MPRALMKETQALFIQASRDFAATWPRLLGAHVVYQSVAFVFLTPVVALALRAFVSFSGDIVLADEDILFFVLSPFGFVAFVIVASANITLFTFEQAALLTLCAGERLGVMAALRDATRYLGSVFLLTAQLVARVLVIVAPFGALAALVYWQLLTEFDINYYLSERPPAFWTAAAIIGVLVAGLAGVLVPKLVGWAFALPIHLFEGVRPALALRASETRTSGHRVGLAAAYVAWALGGALFSAVAFGIGAGLGRWLVAMFQSSMLFLPIVMGGLFLLASLMSLALTWVQAAFFVLLTLRLYQPEGTSSPSWEERGDANRTVSVKSLLAALVAGTLVAGVTGFVLVDSVRMDDDVLVIAHRGAAGRAPENTLAALAAAIEDGADLLEIDVQETIDGEVVVIHDSDFMKIAGDPRKVWDITYEETRAIDIGSWFAPEFSSERLPSLEEVLELARGKVRVDIELKYYGHEEQLEERVVSIVEDADMVPEVVIMSLSQAAIRKVRTLRPSWTIGLLTATALGDLTRVDADFLAVHTGMATSRFVRAAHKAGKDVFVWTVNDPVRMSRMIGRGVDGIITDEPALAKRVLAERAELSSLERLLLEAALWLGAAPPERSPSTDVPPEALL